MSESWDVRQPCDGAAGMMPEHVERAVREGCPRLREPEACAFVALGCCPIVEMWQLAHSSWPKNGGGCMPARYRDLQPKAAVNGWW